MSLFFACANDNQALILETFGVPTIALRSEACVPFPCCQDVRKFKTGVSQCRFESREFKVADGTNISVVCSVTYCIDTSSRGSIMKAYKSYYKSDEKFSSRMNSINSLDADKETDVEGGIKEIITNLMINKFKLMDFNDIVKIDLVALDKIFEEAKAELHFNKVELKSLNIKEFIEYVDVVEETGEEKHEEIPADHTSDSDAIDTFVVTVIPEGNSTTGIHTETEEVKMNVDASIAEETVAEGEASSEGHTHCESNSNVQLPVVTNEIEVSKEGHISTEETIAEHEVLHKVDPDIEINTFAEMHTTTTEIHVSDEGGVSAVETVTEVEVTPDIHNHFEPSVSIPLPVVTNEIEVNTEENISTSETIAEPEALNEIESTIEINTSAEMHTVATDVLVIKEGGVSGVGAVTVVEVTPDIHVHIEPSVSIPLPVGTKEIEVHTEENISTVEPIAEPEALHEIDSAIKINTSAEMHTNITEVHVSKEEGFSVVETVSEVEVTPDTHHTHIESNVDLCTA